MINFHNKTTKQALLQQTKQSTKQMEEETKKMEVRLQELKLAMENERQQRALSGNSGFWSRGQAGALTNYKSVSAGAKKPAPPTTGPSPLGTAKTGGTTSLRKVKLIKDEPLNLPDRSAAAAIVPGTLAHLARRGPAADEEPPSVASPARRQTGGRGRGGAGGGGGGGGAPRCGQCEDRAAAVVCPECAEEYCARCFAAFHLKGALRKHRSLPISAVTTPRQSLGQNLTSTATTATASGDGGVSGVFEDTSRQSRRNMVRQLLQGEEEETERTASTSEAVATTGGGALLSGEVDERQNAEEFRRALAEWRSGGGGEAPSATTKKTKIVTAEQQRQQQQQHKQPRHQTSSHATATDDDNVGRLSSRLEIKFTSSLSYAEQLLLQKHRRADVGKMPGYQGGEGGRDSENGTFEEIRNLQRQQKELASTPRSSENSLEHLPARTNRAKIDDLFPPAGEADASVSEQAPSDEPESEAPTPRASSSRPGTARSQQRKQPAGLEWQRPKTPAGSGRSSATSRQKQQQQHRLTAAAAGGLAGVLARQSLMSTMEASSSTDDRSFLLMGVAATSSAGKSASSATRRQGAVAPWSSGDSRPSSAASSRPSSALSNRFYALSGRQSWRPDASLRGASLNADQLLRTRAEADRLLMTTSAGPRPDSGRMRLEDVEIETEARVLAAMPLSRPVSARTERQRMRASAATPRLPSTALATEELDVTADYLQDDVEHLSRLAIELASREEGEATNSDEEAPQPPAPSLVGRELTQEDKERQLQEWDDCDMDKMDTERYNDRDEVRQLH